MVDPAKRFAPHSVDKKVTRRAARIGLDRWLEETGEILRRSDLEVVGEVWG